MKKFYGLEIWDKTHIIFAVNLIDLLAHGFHFFTMYVLSAVLDYILQQYTSLPG